jgi:hypothetical protein
VPSAKVPRCQSARCARCAKGPDVPRGTRRAERSRDEIRPRRHGVTERHGDASGHGSASHGLDKKNTPSLATWPWGFTSVASRRMLPGFRRPRGRFAPERTHGRSPQAAPDAPAVCGFAREFVQRPAEGRPRGLLVVRVPPCLRASAAEFSSPRVSLVRRSSRPSNRSSANQYRLFCWRTRSNFAVSAIAMTAMTPA